MSTVTDLDFDAWRKSYGKATFEEQQAFYSDVFLRYPVQRHFNLRAFQTALQEVGTDDLHVVELGGWDGALAGIMLIIYQDIGLWTNLEICREIVQHPACFDPRYEPVALRAHVWENPRQVPPADLAVATHTFEHLSLEHAMAAIEALDPSKGLYVEIPLNEEPVNWDGYFGSHILEVGWRGFEEALFERGYENWMRPAPTCRLYARKEH